MARNDSSGHYTCDPVTGDKVCLDGYEDPTTDCREASGTKAAIYHSTPVEYLPSARTCALRLRQLDLKLSCSK